MYNKAFLKIFIVGLITSSPVIEFETYDRSLYLDNYKS